MEFAHRAWPAQSVRTVSASSADALTVDRDRDGNVVIRHRDVFEEFETLMVIPREYALRLAEAIGVAAVGEDSGPVASA